MPQQKQANNFGYPLMDMPYSNIPYTQAPPRRTFGDFGQMLGLANQVPQAASWISKLFGGGAGAAGAAGASGGLMGALGGPIGLGLMGANLLGGLFGGISASKQQKKKEKSYKEAQAAYQKQAASLFPEMDKASFQYQNPALNNAYQSALAYRLGNLFSGWGMPQGSRAGAGNINDLFAGLMSGSQQGMPQMPQGGGQGGGQPRKRTGGRQSAQPAYAA